MESVVGAGQEKKRGKHSNRLNSNILSSLLLTTCKITFKFYSAERTKQYIRTISATHSVA